MKLEWLGYIANWGRDMTENRIKERTHIFALCFHIWLGKTTKTATK